MRLYTHASCIAHSAGDGHPESPARLRSVLEAIDLAGFDGIVDVDAPAATRLQLLRAHTAALVSSVLDIPTYDLRRIDADTAMNTHSAKAALHSAGAVCAAIDEVLKAPRHGTQRRAFCAVRPPGHHATRAEAMGFCLFNSVAVGAAHALAVHGLDRIAIVDFDVHHGNGTQDIFWNDSRVMYVSSHQQAIYPGTGESSERGVTDNIVNAPLAAGCDGVTMRHVYREILLPALNHFRPQLLLISAGFDAHRLDPLAGLNFNTEDFVWLTRELIHVAERHAEGRVVSTLEGGYSLTALRECSVAHVAAMLEAA
ncbi:MAG: histone deacetylase family protein [Pseudomarimonas sp.]